ncbi:amino acid adenylation domain-containing protein [Streptomyces albireticuli]|uniref:amino acid adenylation domain-containing protein n=1 Tax=Streptomyces albireticuli TaxID=1940 RepID=UPI0036A87575
MSTSVEDGQKFWRGVLAAGGFTAVPQWTLDPVKGVAEHEAVVPDDLLAASERLADALAVPLGSVLLAAHVRVLAALSGEREVVTGYATGYATGAGGPVLPCRVTTGSGSWRDLVLACRRAESDLLAHRDVPLDGLRRELGMSQPLFETVLDPAGDDDGGGRDDGDEGGLNDGGGRDDGDEGGLNDGGGRDDGDEGGLNDGDGREDTDAGGHEDAGGLGEGTVLRVGLRLSGRRPVLRLRYRTEVLDADGAARITGYHLTALALMTAGPDTGHEEQSLLSDAELRFQLEGLAGPVLRLPDRRFHELFEERVRMRPDAVAAVHGDRRWTYRELNARANRLGRALLARGLGREDVVAVVAERGLDWMSAVLAVFKAGGVYLPVEPSLPSGRIAAMLARAGCRLVLTEPGGTAALDQALPSLPAVRTLSVGAADTEGHSEDDLGVVVLADQLAYIFFTSGSTGEPKGAMCEHAGMLNHLYAKIGDLGIREGQAVAQTAPQCFDISLWQLLAALLVGGRTVLVGQETVLDVPRFVDAIAEGRVGVLQVVPSYLEAVLSHLERDRCELPDLRCVSVTGEALKKELVQRWFAARPGIRLVNAYGLTETSDDTNHEVMDRAPDGDRVPLGPCVNNVRAYVVDEHLRPVPLGAPGEIVFSGVCVGRGYVNDPERTAPAFMDDPYRPGRRLYRSGDFGRWLPEGKLEFLGRRDAQIKIRGFRIETGDIENALLRTDGVRDGAVVVTGQPGRDKRLVAFYTGPRPLETGVLRDRLGESLPEYMVPSVFHWCARLPLTPNSKTDKKSLTELAAELDTVKDGFRAPRTPTERWLARAWATALDAPPDRIGRDDHFFDRGGTSLAAVKMAIALDRAVTLKDLTRHPVLADLAKLVDGRSKSTAGHRTAGPFPDRDHKGITMTSPSPSTPVHDVDLLPGSPPVLRTEVTGDPPAWVADHRKALRAAVAEHGAILVRGLGLHDVAGTGAVVRELVTGLMAEKESFAPRHAHTGGLYSSTKWPRNQPMCMHHELSYRLEFPGLMLFACLKAPTGGGATAVADAAAVLKALPAELVGRFEREGWLLTRNYNDEIGASIAEAFGTEDRGAIEGYCRANAIECAWQPGGGLRTRQRRSAVVRHPVAGLRCWFNQAAFLSEWTMAAEVREYLMDLYGADGLPFNTCFGGGDPIDEDTVRLLNAVYEAHTVREPWQDGDLMLVDNIRTAHSREPFEGPREVLVAMADAVRLADCSPTIEVIPR